MLKMHNVKSILNVAPPQKNIYLYPKKALPRSALVTPLVYHAQDCTRKLHDNPMWQMSTQKI